MPVPGVCIGLESDRPVRSSRRSTALLVADSPLFGQGRVLGRSVCDRSERGNNAGSIHDEDIWVHASYSVLDRFEDSERALFNHLISEVDAFYGALAIGQLRFRNREFKRRWYPGRFRIDIPFQTVAELAREIDVVAAVLSRPTRGSDVGSDSPDCLEVRYIDTEQWLGIVSKSTSFLRASDCIGLW